MIAVVTGATGFVGQNLVQRLRRDGHQVRCLVRSHASRPEGASTHLVDYDDPRSLRDCEALDGADVVFHLAAATKGVRSRDFVAANVVPARHLLGALVARRLTPRFLFVSSQAAAGPAVALTRPVTETDEPRPVEAYGQSKLEAERVVRSFGDRVPYTIVRPSSVFGPWDRDFLTLFRFARHGAILYPGVATHWLSLVNVHDAVEAILAAGSAPHAAGQTYFIAGETPVRWRDLGEEIARVVGRPVTHLNVPRPVVQAGAIAGELWARIGARVSLANRAKAALSRHPYWVCAASRARAELGFSERRSLPDALRDTYLWYRDHGWLGGSHGSAASAH